jgi:hypothetical protein
MIGGGLFFLFCAIIWIYQFMDLMMMPDDDFPGRFDKILWVATFLVLFTLVAPLAFGLWKEKNRQRLRKRQRALAETSPSEEKPGPAQPTTQDFQA